MNKNNKSEPLTLTGLATARGFALGPVFVFRGSGEMPIPEYALEPGREGDELTRLRRAVFDAKRDLSGLAATLRERTGGEDARVFEGHMMLVEDPELYAQAEKVIREERLNAEAAVRRTARHARALFERMTDPYFKERVRDLEDVERRLLKNLLGFGFAPQTELKEPSIVVADDLTPSETVQLPRECVLGFATNGGSTTSHVALLARAMGIPAVTGLGDVTSRVEPGGVVLLDGTNGTLTISPTREQLREFRDLIERQREISEEVVRGGESGTLKDGGRVLLYANIHPGVPLDGIREQGAAGVGLYRSEYLWLTDEGEPSEEVQYMAYRAAAEFAATLSETGSLTIRALDIGGDKMVRGISQRSNTRQREPNPFLGNRSIRYLLSHRDVFVTQLRAILRASAQGNVRLMYPMVSCLDELRVAADVMAEVKAALAREGIPFDPALKVGAMIEVPSAALNARVLARHVDFFSIGTNDLIQYTMAADRGNEAVAHLYQPLNPAVLRLMRETIAAAKEAGIPVSVCGETASDPTLGVLWAALGVDELSMSATYIPVISKLLSKLTRADLAEYHDFVCGLGPERTAAEAFEECRAWLGAKIPDLSNIIL